MSARLDEFGDRTTVVLITFTDAAAAERYAARQDLGFDVLRDPDRRAYEAYGFGRGRWRRVWSLRSLRKYAEIIRTQGFGGLERSTEDTLQLGGDIVIDPDGNLAWGFWGDGPDERPSVDDLVTAVTRTQR